MLLHVASLTKGLVLVGLLAVCLLFLKHWSIGKSQPTASGIEDTVVWQADSGLWREGDLLFRKGHGMASELVTSVSQGDYSHIGMAVRENGRWKVVHAVPNEGLPSDTDRVKCEPADSFFMPERAGQGAWARVKCSDEVAQRVAMKALRKAKEGIPFDHDYQLGDSTSLYCTELICLVYRGEQIDLAENRRHQLIIPGKTEWYIFPRDIWDSPAITLRKVMNVKNGR